MITDTVEVATGVGFEAARFTYASGTLTDCAISAESFRAPGSRFAGPVLAADATQSIDVIGATPAGTGVLVLSLVRAGVPVAELASTAVVSEQFVNPDDDGLRLKRRVVRWLDANQAVLATSTLDYPALRTRYTTLRFPLAQPLTLDYDLRASVLGQRARFA